MQVAFTDYRNEAGVVVQLTAYDADSIVVPRDADIDDVVNLMRSFIRKHRKVDTAVIHQLICHHLFNENGRYGHRPIDKFRYISADLADIIQSRIRCKDIKQRMYKAIVKDGKNWQRPMYYTEVRAMPEIDYTDHMMQAVSDVDANSKDTYIPAKMRLQLEMEDKYIPRV